MTQERTDAVQGAHGHTPGSGHESLHRAPYVLRFEAFAIDMACFAAVYGAGDLVVRQLVDGGISLWAQTGLFVGVNVLFVAYLSLMEASRVQGSLGKLILGLKVTTRSGGRCSLGHVLARNGVKMFTVAWVTALMFRLDGINHLLLVAILFSISSNPIWHDFMAVTVSERHPYGLVHDDVGRTLVLRSR